MRKILLKVFITFLFLIQIGIVYLCLFSANAYLPALSNIHGVILEKKILLALIITFLIISFYFVILIYMHAGKTITVVKQVLIKDSEKKVKEGKSKKTMDLERKEQQAQIEKKMQMISDLMKNLDVNLSIENYTNQLLINISKHYDIFQGIFFIKDKSTGVFKKAGTYAYYTQDDVPEFAEGVGLTGQVAANRKLLNMVNIPEKYITVLSGLGKSSPSNLLIFPILHNDISIGIVELASFIKFDTFAEQLLMEASGLVGLHIFEISKKVEEN